MRSLPCKDASVPNDGGRENPAFAGIAELIGPDPFALAGIERGNLAGDADANHFAGMNHNAVFNRRIERCAPQCFAGGRVPASDRTLIDTVFIHETEKDPTLGHYWRTEMNLAGQRTFP